MVSTRIVQELITATRSTDGGATYDAQAAYLLSIISTWCYSDRETLLAILRRDSLLGPTATPGLEQYSVKNPALPVDANGYLITLPGQQDMPLHVLCFRGTEPTNLTDLFTDALIEKHVWGGDGQEWVHRGFFLSIDVLWPLIERDLSKLGDAPILITGHSLGGAMAVLAARRILDEGLDVKIGGVYTFGQPMVGSDAFAARSINLPLYRHVFDKDLVPHLPPQLSGTSDVEAPSDYQHFGTVYYPKDNSSGQRVWSRCVDPVACERLSKAAQLDDIMPAFLTLMTKRGPILERALSLLLERLGAVGWLLDRVGRPLWTDLSSEFSVNDHIPTHYVDVSKAAIGTSELALDT